MIHNAHMKTLLEKTLDLAKAKNINVTQTCREVGVTPRWYYKLINNEIVNPGVNHIQRLHDALKSAPDQPSA